MQERGFHLGFNKKLLLIYTLILLASLLLVGQALYSLHSNLMDDRRQKIRQLVETTSSLLVHYQQKSLDGLALEEAQEKAKNTLRQLRYGAHGYFWVNDLETRLLVHPTRTYLEGDLQHDYQDSHGASIFQDFVALVLSQGSGYVHYHWPKPGETQPVEKLSYVLLYEPWGWVLGTGIYLDEMESIFWKEARGYVLVSLLLLLVISYLVWNILRVDARAFQSNQLMGSVMEACAEAMLVTDVNTRIVWANSAFEQLTGYSPDEIMGKTPAQLSHSGKQDKAFYEQMWASLRRGHHWSGELVNRHKNGNLYYEQMTITPVKNRAGRISHYVAIKKDISQRKQEQLRLEQQASCDSLTGLANRRTFMERLGTHLEMQDQGVMIMLDLDHFKAINDTYGHHCGDLVLQHFATILKGQIRETDLFGRLGGEEFALLAPHCSLEQGLKLAEKLSHAFISQPLKYNGESLAVSVSLGVTAIRQTDIKPEILLDRADKALYQAKKDGRACVRCLDT